MAWCTGVNQVHSRARPSRLPGFKTRAGDARGEAIASLRVLPAETMVDGLPRARSELSADVTRRDGLSSLESNTLWASGHVEWQFKRNIC